MLGVLLKCALAMAIRGRSSYDSHLRHRRRRRARNQRRRSGWALVTFCFLSCLIVATYLLWYSARSTETTTVATVDRPTSAEAPEPPASERSHAVEELRSKLP